MPVSFGIDIGTQNLKIFSGSNSQITNIKNTIAIVNKNQMYAYGDAAYSMFEKAPDKDSYWFSLDCSDQEDGIHRLVLLVTDMDSH